MALSLTQTDAVEKLLKPGMRVASLGYPDIIAQHIASMGLEFREDSDAICKRHGIPPRKIPDAHAYFRFKGCELDVFDVVKERGCEIEIDLNYLVPMMHWRDKGEKYDLVLDVGTAEHCFNIGQALINMAGMVKQGGYIIHENPANQGNHGLYNLNPTLFYDFYTQNGFWVEELKLVTRDGRSAAVPHTNRFRFPDEEANIFCIAKRTKVKSFIYPVQTKYKGLIPAAEDRAIKEIANG